MRLDPNFYQVSLCGGIVNGVLLVSARLLEEVEDVVLVCGDDEFRHGRPIRLAKYLARISLISN